jgi:hypothetical protein
MTAANVKLTVVEININDSGTRGRVVAEALCYKSGSRGLRTAYGGIFQFTQSFRSH